MRISDWSSDVCSSDLPIDAEARMRRTGLARRSVIAGLASLGLAGTSWARAAPKVMEKNLVVETADGSAEAALFYPVGKGRWPAVLFCPDAIGLPAPSRAGVRRFAAKAFAVLSPKPFYRSTPPTVAAAISHSKSVVWGKSVPVGVELGVCGI